MADDQRIPALIKELTSDPGYTEGRRRFPRTLTAYDAVQISGWVQKAVDQGTAERDRAAERQGVTIACKSGCHHCCEQPVTVFWPEAIRIAEWLRLPRNAATKEAFLAAYPTWRERAGDGFEAILDAAAVGDRPAQEAAHLAQWRRRAMCAFNREGLCSIYEVRPATCRYHHAIDTNELCKIESCDGKQRARGMPFRPLDDFVERARLLERAVHHALGGERLRPRPLCQAVHEALHTDDPRLKAVPSHSV